MPTGNWVLAQRRRHFSTTTCWLHLKSARYVRSNVHPSFTDLSTSQYIRCNYLSTLRTCQLLLKRIIVIKISQLGSIIRHQKTLFVCGAPGNRYSHLFTIPYFYSFSIFIITQTFRKKKKKKYLPLLKQPMQRVKETRNEKLSVKYLFIEDRLYGEESRSRFT